MAHSKSQKSVQVKKCFSCGKDFETASNAAKYCPDCRPVIKKIRKRKWNVQHGIAKQAEPYEKICPVCGKEFSTTRGYQKYCSPQCCEVAHKELKKIRRQDPEVLKREREWNRQYYAKNRELLREYKREWTREFRAKNPEYHREYMRAWRAMNPS